MIEVSCFYMDYNYEPINFTFIKYEKFMKIILQKRKIVISFKNLLNHQILYKYYILSLITTEDTSKIYSNLINPYDGFAIYGISTEKIWKYLYYDKGYDIVPLEKDYIRNPFKTREPIRETSIKKQKKLFKMMNSYYYDKKLLCDPMIIMNNYLSILILSTNVQKIINYEKEIYLLCCIRGFNKDIYSTIKKFI